MADVASVEIFDRRGVRLGELQPDIEEVSWVLGGVGRMRLSVARSDPEATPDMLRFGNLLRVQFANGLPDWGGVIEPPRAWGESHIRVEAFGGEYLLGFRQTGRGRYFTQVRVGHIFASVIGEANAAGDMLVDVGQVWQGGNAHSPEYHFHDLLTIVQESIAGRLTPADFVLEPVVEGGALRFRASLLERRGRRLPGVALVEGNNLGVIQMLEQGPIVNRWVLVGEGTTWGEDRLVATAEDRESIAEFGLREDSEVRAGVTVLATLEEAVAERIRQTAWPRVMLELEAVDERPGRFADYDVGDTVTAQLFSYGFGGYLGQVRVLGREYRPGTGTCKLVVREERSE
jgi:hypothetical protein